MDLKEDTELYNIRRFFIPNNTQKSTVKKEVDR